ncbi:MAG: hypothetical protein EXR47_01815 [Dehalococcoidia bacterium]|nr:hypothetical protein [Dehalococcoidia bacterium]
MSTQNTTQAITVTVELYGVAHMVGRERKVKIAVAPDATIRDAIAALADACPRLVGRIISDDCSRFLVGYVFNHNGVTFLDAPDAKLGAQSGDVLILMSSMAGG